MCIRRHVPAIRVVCVFGARCRVRVVEFKEVLVEARLCRRFGSIGAYSILIMALMMRRHFRLDFNGAAFRKLYTARIVFLQRGVLHVIEVFLHPLFHIHHPYWRSAAHL